MQPCFRRVGWAFGIITKRNHFLPAHQIHFIHIDSLLITENCQNDCQSHSSFGGSNGHGEKDKDLPRAITQEAGKSDKREIHGIEHKLNAHKHNNCITARQNANSTNAKDCAGKHKVVFKRYRLEHKEKVESVMRSICVLGMVLNRASTNQLSSLRLASVSAPTTAVKSRSDTASKGKR